MQLTIGLASSSLQFTCLFLTKHEIGFVVSFQQSKTKTESTSNYSSSDHTPQSLIYRVQRSISVSLVNAVSSSERGLTIAAWHPVWLESESFTGRQKQEKKQNLTCPLNTPTHTFMHSNIHTYAYTQTHMCSHEHTRTLDPLQLSVSLVHLYKRPRWERKHAELCNGQRESPKQSVHYSLQIHDSHTILRHSDWSWNCE